MHAARATVFLLAALTGCASLPGKTAGPTTATRSAIMAVVDSALSHINRGDLIALSDLMIPEAQMFPAQERTGRGGTYTMRTVAAQRATGKRAPIIERGDDPIVRVAGTSASVWMPYDLLGRRQVVALRHRPAQPDAGRLGVAHRELHVHD
jgi:hypothetical protein